MQLQLNTATMQHNPNPTTQHNTTLIQCNLNAIQQVVPQKSFVDDVEYVMQEEAYTDYEQVPHTRMKEIWVKRMVPETVYETVAVPKTRQRTVAQPVVREVTTLAEVNVPVEEIVREPCYRIDEVCGHGSPCVPAWGRSWRMMPAPTKEGLALAVVHRASGQ